MKLPILMLLCAVMLASCVETDPQKVREAQERLRSTQPMPAGR